MRVSLFWSLDASTEFFLTCVYASPRPILREELWLLLPHIATLTSVPWVVIGDFNSSLLTEEKYGGAPPSERLMSRFRTVLNQCGLIDLGFVGHPFTWEWRGVKEHHNALLLDNLPTSSSPRTHSFKFLASWLEDSSFKGIVSKAWDTGDDWSVGLCVFQKNVMEWNQNVFGNIFQKKGRVLSRIEGVHKHLTMGPHGRLDKLHKKLWEEYQSILRQEEAYWYHKARKDWIAFGDQNTHFFHISSIAKRRKNRIVSLTSEDGEEFVSGGPTHLLLAGTAAPVLPSCPPRLPFARAIHCPEVLRSCVVFCLFGIHLLAALGSGVATSSDHLICNGIDETYKCWTKHGETIVESSGVRESERYEYVDAESITNDFDRVEDIPNIIEDDLRDCPEMFERLLYNLLLVPNMWMSRFCFINPTKIGLEYTHQSQYIGQIFIERNQSNTLFLAPYNTGAIKIYRANKDTKVSKVKFSNIKWTMIKCPIQDNGSDCGYYVLRYMKEILLCSEEGVIPHEYFPTYKFEKYSTEHIDEVKQEWCRYVLENIITNK
ncbi:Ulp1 protease family, C-terminal catalytic domain [Sesbania bispinosa]|nr:Ulp1 protease family, C-terminal catalytic domain [Sesbania bispinosa]